MRLGAIYIYRECRYYSGRPEILVLEMGLEVSVLNETGGREVMIHDRLSAHQAYIMALYRHRPQLIERMKALVEAYADEHASDRGTMGSHVTIVNSGYIKKCAYW